MEIREFRSVLRNLEREILRSLDAQSVCCGVSLPQCHVIMELEGAGCVNLTGLAKRMDLDKSTLSRTVDGLVRLGLIQRGDDPRNRRQQIICLSPAGAAKAQAINDLCDREYAELFTHLDGGQRDTMFQGITLLSQAMGRHRATVAEKGGCDVCN